MPPSADSTLLHVVYAGRGDALYLEYTYINGAGDEHMLVPLDGGPLTTTVKTNDTSKGKSPPRAPYYKYYLAVGEHVWEKNFKNPKKFSPNAIINSHPHDDHLDGLVYLMTSQCGKAMEFKGPFILPNENCKGRTEVETMAEALGFTSSFGCQVPGVNFYFPSPIVKEESILSWSYPSPPVETRAALMEAPTLRLGDRPVIDITNRISIDTSSANLQSILMDVDPDKTKGKGRMFFTGDSVGYKIREFVALEHYTIYKIQHHGSLRNTQFDKTVETVRIEVARETALLALVRYIYDGTPDALFINPPSSVGLKDFFKSCLTDDEENVFGGYKRELERRNAIYLKTCAKKEKGKMVQLKVIPWKPDEKALRKTRAPGAIWAAIEDGIDAAEPEEGKYLTSKTGQIFYKPPTGGVVTRNVKFALQPWTESLLNVKLFQNNFKAILLTGSISQFFGSFTADAYVVSANTSHYHPSASTIAGLAIAVHNRAPARPVPLYATDGYAIDMNSVINYVKEIGMNPDEVFNGKSLVIQYLASGVYMTINGNGGDKAPGPSESRDVLGVTKRLPTDPKARIDLAEAHRKFDKNSGLIPDRLIDRGVKYRYRITAPVQEGLTQKRYLTLDKNTAKPGVTTTPPASPFIVLNSWASDASTFEYYQVYQEYDSLVANRLRLGKYHDADDGRWWEIGFMDGPNMVKFYVKSDGTFGLVGWDQDLPMGGIRVFFRLEDVTPSSTALLGQQVSAITSMVAHLPAALVAVPRRTGRTLNEFCIAAGITAKPPFSALQSLQALIGIDNLSALGIRDGFEKLILPYPTELASAVEFTDNGLDMEVNSASLTLEPPADASIDIGGEKKKITAVVITLQWPSTPELSIMTTISTEDGMSIIKTRKLAATALPISLKKTLATMGIEASKMEELGAPNAVAYLTADQVGLLKLFYDRVPMTFLMAGLIDLKPDLEMSTVEAWYDPTGLPAIKRAQVICLTPGDTWQSLFNLGGIELVLGQVGILLDDALLPTQTITIYGSAVFKTQAQNADAVKLLLSCQLNKAGDVEVNFSVVSSWNRLGSHKCSSAVPQRASLDPGQHFQAGHHLYAVYRAYIRLQALKGIRQHKFLRLEEFPARRVPYQQPRLNHRLGASVALELKVGSETTTQKIVRLGFAANPLGTFGDYEYRLAAFASDSGLSIADISTAIGLTGVTEALTAAGSLVSQLATEVRIRSFSVGVVKTNDAWKFADWSLDVAIDNFVIIKDALKLSNVSVVLENSSGLLMGDLSGSIQIALFNLECFLRLPTKSLPGLISITSPNGVSAADIISALKLPDVSSIPVLGTLLSTQLETARFTIGYLPNKEGESSLSWLGSSFTFELDEVSVTDSLVIEGISVAIGYHSEHDPFGPGKTQFVFLLKAALFDNTLIADIIYDSLVSEIEFALTSPDPTNTAKISDMVGTLLGSSFQYALEPLVGNMAIDEAILKLSTADGIKVKYFMIYISDAASAEFQGLAMKSLSVEYTAAKAAQGDKPAEPQKFVLQGSIQKGKVGARLTIECISADGDKPTQVSFILDAPPGTELYLSGLVDLFSFSDPSYSKPDKCPDFTGLAIKTIQGKVSLQADAQTGKKSLSLDSLDAYIESVSKIDILESPAVTLQSISLHLYYETKTFSGQVYGHLTIETVDIWAYYEKDTQGNQVFKGQLLLSNKQTPVPFDKLAATFLPNAADYTIPSVLNAPSEIPLFVFGVTLIPDKSIEVWGTGQLPLKLDASGYTVSMAKIGGMVRRIKASDALALPDRYSAILIGELQFNTFKSARASITIGTGQTTMLTASITSQSSTVNLDGLTAPLSGDGSTLKTISPAGTSDMSFGSSGYLCVDFTNSKLFLFGQLAPPISAYGMIMGEWKPSGTTTDRRYIVSVATQNLSQIWNDLNVPVLSAFNFSLAGGQIVSWSGTIEDLHAELSAFVAAAQYAKVDVTDVSSTLLALPQKDQVPRGGALFATLDIKGGSVANRSIAASLEPTLPPPTLTFYAMLNKTDPKQSKFMVSMQKMYLFGGALLFNGTAEYYFDGPRLVALGSMQLTLSAASSVTLQMELDVSEKLTSFKLQGQPSGDDTLTNPFGDMFNVQLKQIVLTGTISKSGEKTQSDYSLFGIVYLGTGILRADLTGSVYFSQGKAVTANLALVAGKQGISVEDIFSNIIQPGDTSSGSWPSGYGTISFQSASIYYSIQDYQLGKQIFKKGYHIAAEIQIFGTPFLITADLGNRKGIVITGQKSDPINLGFLQLTGQIPTTPPTPPAPATGPSVTIDTTGSSTVYKAEVGIQLFDLPQLDATFLYQQGEASLKCIVQYTGTFLGVTNPHVTVLYKDGKFSLADWQMIEDMLDKVDLAKAITEASESDPSACKKLVGLVFDKTVKTKFNFTLGDASVKDGSLQFNLKWTYDITIVIPGAPDVHIPGIKLPDLPITVSPPYKLSQLDQLLINSILASIKKIGAALLDPANLQQFMILIAAMKAKEWTKDLIEGLLCRQAGTDNVKERGEDIADEDAHEMDKPDNPGNQATKAADIVKTATDLVTALGSLATAVECGAEFAAFLGGAVGLLSALLPWFTDKTKLEQLKKKATDQGKKTESAVQNATGFVGKVLNLSVSPNPPISKYTPSETLESTIELNWGANKPNWPGFNYGNFENVVWEVKMGLVDNVDDPSMHDLTSNTFSLTYSDPSFAFGSSVYSYIRARATVPGGPFYSTNWARARPAVHIPWLSPVSQVGFQASASGTYSCAVSIPGAGIGKYHVQVVGSSSSSTTVLYEGDSVATSAGTISLNVGIYDFIPVTSTITGCYARVKVVSPDSSTSHDSPYTDSLALTPVAAPPTNLQATYSQKAVTVVWDQPSSGINDFDLLVVKADGTLDTTVAVTSLISPAGQRKASLTGPSIVEGAKLIIAARARPGSSVALGLFAFLSYTIPLAPTPQIAPESYYNMENQKIYLTMNFPSPPPSNLQFTLQLHPTSGPLPPPFPGIQGTFSGNTVYISVYIAILTARETASITVASFDPVAGQQGDFSSPWQFPKIPQSLPACSPSAIFTSAGSVQVSWSWDGITEATAQQVTILFTQQPTMTLISTVQRPNTVATFTMDQSKNQFTPGQSLKIQCVSLAPGITGGVASIDFSIPGSNGWTPYALVNQQPMEFNCTMTNIALSANNTLQLWWTSSDGSIQTALLQNGSWTGSQFMAPYTVSVEGACLTSTTRGWGHQEIWWVTGNGAINGRYWLNDGIGWRPATSGPGGPYPFNQPGTASTTAGGSIASMSRAGSRMDVWWVAPNGSIGNARWNQVTGWGSVFTAAPSGTAGFGNSISGLAVKSLDNQTVDIFYIGTGGSVGGAFSSDPSATTQYALYNLAPVGTARLDGGFTSLQLSSQQIVLFWVSLVGNIEMLVLTRNTAVPSRWNTQQQAVTEPGSASGTSGIAASSTGTSQFSVWWNGPQGPFSDLRRIDVDLTKGPAQWPVYEQLGVGSCRKTRTLMFGSINSTQRHLWYVNSSNKIQGMSSGR